MKEVNSSTKTLLAPSTSIKPNSSTASSPVKEVDVTTKSLSSPLTVDSVSAASTKSAIVKGVGSSFIKEDAVEARYGGCDRWFKGKIINVNSDGTYDLRYDDGDTEAGVRAEYMRPLRKIENKSIIVASAPTNLVDKQYSSTAAAPMQGTDSSTKSLYSTSTVATKNEIYTKTETNLSSKDIVTKEISKPIALQSVSKIDPNVSTVSTAVTIEEQNPGNYFLESCYLSLFKKTFTYVAASLTIKINPTVNQKEAANYDESGGTLTCI